MLGQSISTATTISTLRTSTAADFDNLTNFSGPEIDIKIKWTVQLF